MQLVVAQRAVLQRVAGVADPLEIAIGELVGVDDRGSAGLQIGDVGS
jgi:hypothetical protein